MRRRAFLLALLALSCAGPLRADDALLKEIAGRVADSPVVHAEFVQTKELAAMRKPFVIAGRFTYARDTGVLWQVESPYRTAYLIGRDGVVEIGADGQRRARSEREAAGIAQAGQVMQALLRADLAPLQKQFVLEPTRQGSGWRVALTPRQPELGRFLKGIRLSGADHVEVVEILEASGDRTQIRFSGIRRERALSPAEAALFAGAR